MSCTTSPALPPLGGLQLITSTADFIRHFPHMSAMGARQHLQQGPCSTRAQEVEAVMEARARDPVVVLD